LFELKEREVRAADLVSDATSSLWSGAFDYRVIPANESSDAQRLARIG